MINLHRGSSDHTGSIESAKFIKAGDLSPVVSKLRSKYFLPIQSCSSGSDCTQTSQRVLSVCLLASEQITVYPRTSKSTNT